MFAARRELRSDRRPPILTGLQRPRDGVVDDLEVSCAADRDAIGMVSWPRIGVMPSTSTATRAACIGGKERRRSGGERPSSLNKRGTKTRYSKALAQDCTSWWMVLNLQLKPLLLQFVSWPHARTPVSDRRATRNSHARPSTSSQCQPNVSAGTCSKSLAMSPAPVRWFGGPSALSSSLAWGPPSSCRVS